MFQKAQKTQSRLRLAVEGPAGAGKTFSSLILAKSLSSKVAVIDTEHGSASLYADRFDFDVTELRPPYTPEAYVDAIKVAQQAGYGVCVIDSLSHEWTGEGGCLSVVDALNKGFAGWKNVTPRHERLINAILQSDMHIIATMRSKAEYAVETNIKGQAIPRKIGTAPIQRDSVEYEFTVVFTLNQNHYAAVSKDRTSLFDGKDFPITDDTGKALISWLNAGAKPEPKPAPSPETRPAEAKSAPEAAEQLTAKGVLEEVKSRDTGTGKKYGLKLAGVGKVFITHSAAAAERAVGFVGKAIAVAYKESIKDGKKQYDMLGFEESK
ncbi:MAG: ATP-binding protein [Elusimicrobiales bacterium]